MVNERAETIAQKLPLCCKINPIFIMLGLAITISICYYVLPSSWLYIDARFVSVIDSVSAALGLAVSVVLILGQKLKEERNVKRLIAGILTVTVLRFFASTTEDMQVTIWLHRFSSSVLGLVLLSEWFSTKQERKRPFSFWVLLCLLVISLALGLALFIVPSLFRPAFVGEYFSSTVTKLSWVNVLIYFIALSLRLRQRRWNAERAGTILLMMGVCDAAAALIFAFSSPWGARWWFSQVLELLPFNILVVALFIDHNQSVLRSNNRLKNIADQLKRANDELDAFTSVVAHDLAEPLRTITSYCEMTRRNYSDRLDDRGKQYLSFAVDGATRLGELIRALLAYSKAGKVRNDDEKVECQALVEETLKSLTCRIEEESASVQLSELPTVVSNRQLLAQVFQNLISNAIKFHHPGEHPYVKISGFHHATEPEWVFVVKDSGIGIQGQYQDQIFHMFRRLHRRTEYPGTGIGLATCKKIIESLGGKIWVESTPGEGTSFFFSLRDVTDECPSESESAKTPTI